MGVPKLKPCPFCGCSASLNRTGYEYGEFWTAGCDAGHAESPGMNTPEAAAEWWNQRPKPARTQAGRRASPLYPEGK